MVSDEIYALSVYDTDEDPVTTFTSVLSIDNEDLIDTDRVHVLYGLSKVCKIPETPRWVGI